MGFGKGSRGPRKKTVQPDSQVVPAAKEEAEAKPKEKKVWYFKSKERQLEVTLIKPTNVHNPDGTRTIEPGFVARFERNSWRTEDPQKAKLMLNTIDRRETQGNPLGAWEASPPE